MLEDLIRVCQNLRIESSDPIEKDKLFAIQRGLIPLIVGKESQINEIDNDVRGFITSIQKSFPSKIKQPSDLETEECKKIVLKILKGF